MPDEHRTKVFYEAIADFSDLTRAAGAAKKAIRELKEEEGKLNKDSIRDNKDSAKARDADAKAAGNQAEKLGKVVRASKDLQSISDKLYDTSEKNVTSIHSYALAQDILLKAVRDTTKEIKEEKTALREGLIERGKQITSTNRHSQALRRLAQASGKATLAHVAETRALKKLTDARIMDIVAIKEQADAERGIDRGNAAQELLAQAAAQREVAQAVKATAEAVRKVPRGQRKAVVDAVPEPRGGGAGGGGGGTGISPPTPSPDRGPTRGPAIGGGLAEWNSIRQATREASVETEEYGKSIVKVKDIINFVVADFDRLGNVLGKTGRHLKESEERVDRFGKNSNNASTAVRKLHDALNFADRAFDSVKDKASSFGEGLLKIAKFRLPGIAAPIGVLLPAFGALLALVNPVVAGLGAIGAAAIGMAASLGTAAGGLALGIIPALVSLLSVVGAVKMAMGGVGNVFAAAKAAKDAKNKASGGGGAGPKPEELTKAEKIARAEEQLKRASEDVKFAQDDLDEARKGYIERLKALKKAVDEAAKAELRLRANQQLARENLANVLADPGSTKGEKMAARAGLAEANDELKKGRDDAKKNAKDLKDMQKKGMEGDKQVIMAKRHLKDALWAQRDAEIALHNAHKDLSGSAGAVAKAEDALADALAKLSPSARIAVKALLAMQGALDKMKKTVQEAFFAPFANNVKNLSKLFPPLTDFLSQAAGAAGRFVDKLITKVTSPEWLTDIQGLGAANAVNIDNIGDALLNVADAFKDVLVVAEPFTRALTGGISRASKEFADMISNARKSGALTEFLQAAYRNLDMWWKIIKNIGGAILNFLHAAEPFGEWLTQGFVDMTAGWKKASEDALKPGSKFKTWLEDVKPLIREIGGAVGDLFKWFGKEASDKNNITQMIDMFKTLREDIGPAIGRIFDSLSKAKIGPKAFDAIGKLLDAIATFLERGGAEGFKTFWEILGGIADVLKIIFTIVPPPVWTAFVTGATLLAAALGAIAVMKFSGLLSVLKLLGKGGLQTAGLFGVGPRTGKFKTQGRHREFGLPGRGTPESIATRAERRRATARKIVRPVLGPSFGVGAEPGQTVLAERVSGRTTRRQDRLAEKAEAKAARRGRFGKIRTALASDEGFLDLGARRGAPGIAKASRLGTLGKVGKTVGKGLGKGGIPGLAAYLVGGYALDKLDDKKGGTRSTASQIGQGALQGGSLGAMIGSIIAPGIGTAIGAAAGAAIGGAVAAAKIDPKQWQKTMDELAHAGDWMTTTWDENVIQPWVDTIIPWIQETWGKVTTWLQEQWSNLVVTPLKWAWDNLIIAPFQAVVTAIQWGWNTFVVVPFQTAIAAITSGWNTVTAWFRARGTDIANAWNRVTAWFRARGADIANAWNNMVGFFRGIPGRIESAWNNMVGFFRGIPGRIHAAWNNMLEWFRNVPGEMIQAVRDWVSQQAANAVDTFVPKPVQNVVKKGVNFVKRLFADGGNVPGTGNTDSVPSMLTPGEYVIRKSVAEHIGTDALDRLNNGLGGMMSGRSYQSGPIIPRQYGAGGSVAPVAPVGVGSGGITVENLNINNPSSERAGDSLPRAIRKLSYIGRGVRPA